MKKTTNQLNLVTKYSKYPVLVTDKDGNHMKYLYEFTMYRTFLLYNVPPIMYRAETRGGHVELEAYGLIIRTVWFEGTDRKFTEKDLGAISAQQYEVNALMQRLHRTPMPSIDLTIGEQDTQTPDEIIFDIVHEETALWNRNHWGNPFGKVAENILKEKLRQEIGASIPAFRPTAELKQKRRNPLSRLHEMFQQGSIPKNDKGTDI